MHHFTVSIVVPLVTDTQMQAAVNSYDENNDISDGFMKFFITSQSLNINNICDCIL